jgi:hypothetical protein
MSRWSWHTVALLVAMSAIGSAMAGANESGLFDEDANEIDDAGMLHAVHKRQAETKPGEGKKSKLGGKN